MGPGGLNGAFKPGHGVLMGPGGLNGAFKPGGHCDPVVGRWGPGGRWDPEASRRKAGGGPGGRAGVCRTRGGKGKERDSGAGGLTGCGGRRSGIIAAGYLLRILAGGLGAVGDVVRWILFGCSDGGDGGWGMVDFVGVVVDADGSLNRT
jgi:hypothetical protein